MSDFLSSIPWWGWVLLGLAVVVIAPIKLKVFGRILASRAKKEEPPEEE